MTAVVCHGPQDYRVEEVSVPTPGPGQVVVEVGAVGICGSDVKCFTGSSKFWGGADSDGFCEPPVIVGHEFAGVVSDLGDGAGERHNLEPGDAVIAEQIIPCGQCRFCDNDQYWMCRPHNIFGFKSGRAEGGMAEFALYPEMARIHKLDPRLSKEQAAYLEPLACAMHAVDRADINAGDTVVIAGIGSIGLCMLQAARAYEPERIIAVGTRPPRMELAAELGADVLINVRDDDPVAAVLDLTDGYGADVCIEASGAGEGPQQALGMVRSLGTLVAFSAMSGSVSIDWSMIGEEKELTIRGSHLGPYCYPKAISALAEGTITVEKLITHRFPLQEFHQAMDTAREGVGIKTMVVP